MTSVVTAILQPILFIKMPSGVKTSYKLRFVYPCILWISGFQNFRIYPIYGVFVIISIVNLCLKLYNSIIYFIYNIHLPWFPKTRAFRTKKCYNSNRVHHNWLKFLREYICDPLCRIGAKVARDHSPWEVKNQVDVDSGPIFFFIAGNESVISFLLYSMCEFQPKNLMIKTFKLVI